MGLQWDLAVPDQRRIFNPGGNLYMYVGRLRQADSKALGQLVHPEISWIPMSPRPHVLLVGLSQGWSFVAQGLTCTGDSDIYVFLS